MNVGRLIVPFAALWLSLACGVASGETAGTYLNGHWSGDGFDLRIDAARSVANIDPERPFDWQRFIVKEVDGRRVVFTVGARLFMAELGEDGMTLTGFDFPGEVRLTRQADPDPAPLSAAAEAKASEDVLRPTLDAERQARETPVSE